MKKWGQSELLHFYVEHCGYALWGRRNEIGAGLGTELVLGRRVGSPSC